MNVRPGRPGCFGTATVAERKSRLRRGQC